MSRPPSLPQSSRRSKPQSEHATNAVTHLVVARLSRRQRSVIRVVLQFLKENSLLNAFQALSAETNVSLNTHSTPDVLYSNIKSGAWDDVLRDISTIEIKVHKVVVRFVIVL